MRLMVSSHKQMLMHCTKVRSNSEEARKYFILPIIFYKVVAKLVCNLQYTISGQKIVAIGTILYQYIFHKLGR